MRIKRFKVILAGYLVLFILACVFIPNNIYFKHESGEHINYGFSYVPVFHGKYENQITIPFDASKYGYLDETLTENSQSSLDWDSIKAKTVYASKEPPKDIKPTLVYLKGKLEYRTNYLLLIVEFIGLTVVSAGLAYITCKETK
ncbi:MAG: hypothetical protein K0Q87_1709 [Neobacillus sp.]|jgi:hypothetical protein|nr:hypothetical protein [Neobacillus sp.]